MMKKKLNVALVGCWHPHVPRYYPILQKREDTVLTCVWDSTPARGGEWAEKLGIPFRSSRITMNSSNAPMWTRCASSPKPAAMRS